jgi:C-terminal processing protease CtpA/Prc
MRAVKGLLGNVILKRFNIVLDYAAKKVYIQPNKLFNISFKFPMSGFKLEKINNELVVSDLNEESEAMKLGVRNGFILLSIDGKKNLTLKEARELLAKPGKKQIEFLDDTQQVLSIKLTLERLI